MLHGQQVVGLLVFSSIAQSGSKHGLIHDLFTWTTWFEQSSQSAADILSSWYTNLRNLHSKSDETFKLILRVLVSNSVSMISVHMTSKICDHMLNYNALHHICNSACTLLTWNVDIAGDNTQTSVVQLILCNVTSKLPIFPRSTISDHSIYSCFPYFEAYVPLMV